MKDLITALIALYTELLGPFLRSLMEDNTKREDIKRVEAANKASANNRKLTTEERLKDAQNRGLYRD